MKNIKKILFAIFTLSCCFLIFIVKAHASDSKQSQKRDKAILKELTEEFMEIKDFFIVEGKLNSITIGEIYRYTEQKINPLLAERNYSTEFFIASQSYKYAFDYSMGGIKDHVSDYKIEEISIYYEAAIVEVEEVKKYRYLLYDYEEDNLSAQVDRIWLKFIRNDGWKIYDIYMEEAFYMVFYNSRRFDLLSTNDAKEEIKRRIINLEKNLHYGTDLKGTLAGNWIKDNVGWWYKHKNGTYTKNGWEMISGKWYYFDHVGYMVTGWIEDDSNWYYCDEDGAAVKGIQYINNRWNRFDLNRKWIGYDD